MREGLGLVDIGEGMIGRRRLKEPARREMRMTEPTATSTPAAARAASVSPEPTATTQAAFESTYELMMDANRKLIGDYLDSIEGEKTIVWDRTIMGPINSIMGPMKLKEHGVIENRAVDQPLSFKASQVIFLMGSTSSALKKLESLFASLPMSEDAGRLFHVLFFPHAPYALKSGAAAPQKAVQTKGKSKNPFEESGSGDWQSRVEGHKELPLYWLPVHKDALSMQQPTWGARLRAANDWPLQHAAAVAVNVALNALGLCSLRFHSRGQAAREMTSMLYNMRKSMDSQKPAAPAPHGINRVVLVDRWLDLITPLRSQLTLVGALDDHFGIDAKGCIKVRTAELNLETGDGKEKPSGSQEFQEIVLDGEIFHTLKHERYNDVGSVISEFVKELKTIGELDRKNMSMAEMAVFVKRLSDLKRKQPQTERYLRLTEILMDDIQLNKFDYILTQKELVESADGEKVHPFIEDAILNAADLEEVLALVALQSQVAAGLKPTVLHVYRRMITQTYGADALAWLTRLQAVGIVKEKSISKLAPPTTGDDIHSFPTLRKNYVLIPPEYEDTDANSLAYPYAGYVPLLVKYLKEGEENGYTDGWHTDVEEGAGDRNRKDAGTILVVVGGVTRAELWLIRRVMPSLKLILTTAVISAKTFLEAAHHC